MELIIFTGLQASGKSSFYRGRFAETHVHVSKDNFRNNSNPSRRQRQLIEEALAAGRSVVVDNTNPTAEDRRELIELARLHDASVVGYYFESKVADCQERNRTREGANRVPDVALFATVKRLECPSRSEGFDQLFFVRLAGPGEFEISDWIEEEKDDASQ
jgi:predicted kinase